jgi:hypothetical protein
MVELNHIGFCLTRFWIQPEIYYVLVLSVIVIMILKL